jgi:hypothetical protein
MLLCAEYTLVAPVYDVRGSGDSFPVSATFPCTLSCLGGHVCGQCGAPEERPLIEQMKRLSSSHLKSPFLLLL